MIAFTLGIFMYHSSRKLLISLLLASINYAIDIVASFSIIMNVTFFDWDTSKILYAHSLC